MEINTIQLTDEVISTKIMVVRKQKVMLDSDLAELYDVGTKRLNEQVKRNMERFPEDFMFQLTEEEWENLKSQFATSSFQKSHGGRRTLPYVFTEHGVLMLSSVLSSKRAIAVNIQIMRVYTQIREMLATNQELIARLEELEDAIIGQDEKIDRVFGYIYQLMENSEDKLAPRKKVGYK
jgi:hypothetical protein